METKNNFSWPYLRHTIYLVSITGLQNLFIVDCTFNYKKNNPVDQWSCKRSPDIWAYHKNKTYKTWLKMAEQTMTLITHNPSFNHLTEFQDDYQRIHHCHILPYKSLSCKI